MHVQTATPAKPLTISLPAHRVQPNRVHSIADPRRELCTGKGSSTTGLICTRGPNQSWGLEIRRHSLDGSCRDLDVLWRKSWVPPRRRIAPPVLQAPALLRQEAKTLPCTTVCSEQTHRQGPTSLGLLMSVDREINAHWKARHGVVTMRFPFAGSKVSMSREASSHILDCLPTASYVPGIFLLSSPPVSLVLS